MDRAFDLPSRAEMEAGLAAFAERAAARGPLRLPWESTRYEDDRLVLETSDGEYRCRAAVFAVGVTEPWRAAVPGLEHAAHYVDTRVPERYAGRDVFIVGKRNSGFEVAQGILPVGALDRPRLAAAGADRRARALGAPRALPAPLRRVRARRARHLRDRRDDRARSSATASGFRVVTHGTTWDGRARVRGRRRDRRDRVPDAAARPARRSGSSTVADGRIPALTPFWESVSLPGIFFAGNASQGARGLGKHGAGASSTSVNGFRYNARVLAAAPGRAARRPEPSAPARRGRRAVPARAS